MSGKSFKVTLVVIALSIFYSEYCCAQKSFLDKSEIDLLVQKSRESKSDALVVYENNKLLVEEYGTAGHRDSLMQPWSCTKSITALAFIALLDDGVLDSLDMPVYHLYPEWNQGQKKEITIEHLLRMSSGLQCSSRLHAEVYPSPDCIKLALSASVIEEPGKVWRYNNKAFGLLADIVKLLTGKSLDKYLAERIFKPLGITHVKWDGDQSSNPYAFMGSHMRAIDFAKLGLLVANRGSSQGKRILSEEHILKLHQPSKTRENYGLGWWMTYYADEPKPYTFEKKVQLIAASGSYGNYILIIPEKNIVVVRFISHKTYGVSDEIYDTSTDEYAPTAFRNLRHILEKMAID